MGKSWYNLTPAKAEGDAVEVLLYDIIGAWGITAKQFAEDLKAAKGSRITLRINSPGGDVMEGAAIVNILRADGRPVTSYIDGLAASMASVIPMVGKVVMPSNALMMIHNPWTVAVGDAEALRKNADLLDKIKGQIVGTYEGKCGEKTKREDLIAMMDAETWLDGKEAVAAGFADECTEPLKAAACAVDVTKFAIKVDARLAALMPAPAEGKPNDATPTVPPVVAAVAPATPALLDAVVVESRIESERALARAEGRAEGIASRDAEVSGLTAEAKSLRDQLAAAKVEIDNSHANVAQLKATVETEKKLRDAAEKAHAALLGGAQYHPVDADEGMDFEQLQTKYGHAEARQRFPAAYATFMRTKAPGTMTK